MKPNELTLLSLESVSELDLSNQHYEFFYI